MYNYVTCSVQYRLAYDILYCFEKVRRESSHLSRTALYKSWTKCHPIWYKVFLGIDMLSPSVTLANVVLDRSKNLLTTSTLGTQRPTDDLLYDLAKTPPTSVAELFQDGHSCFPLSLANSLLLCDANQRYDATYVAGQC